ncbi:branched-chain amino acid transport system II carrier protein [Priestia sp. GS2]|uniref:branched-chain amino acid transport system II carrier protein n=1 Tax=Priestia sp. GS2 TaxID=3117403 RepID=UPI002ED8D3EA
MNALSRKDTLFISLMLFSLFFGAGNLIFPPFLGQSAGSELWPAVTGFILSAVGLPILGVIAVAKSNGLQSLANRVHPVFAVVFTVMIYLAIGPFLGIPRAGSLAFEMGVQPFLPEGVNVKVALFGYTFCYFALGYWLALKPSKLVDRFGKVLTPVLLVLISLIFIRALSHPFEPAGHPAGNYVTKAFATGFTDGYATMDTIAALNFGIVIAMALKQKGMTDTKSIMASSIRAGVIAGTLLAIIYLMLAYLGSVSHADAANGAVTLTNIVFTLFGPFGAVLLGIVFTLACLTTSVGLLTSCSQYFEQLVPKVSYKVWVSTIALFSLLVANLGLTMILKISVPVLTAIYPVAIMLIVLSLTNSLFKGKQGTYALSVLFVGAASITDACLQSGVNLGAWGEFVRSFPFYNTGFGWLIPALVGTMGGYLFSFYSLRDKLVRSQEAKPYSK